MCRLLYRWVIQCCCYCSISFKAAIYQCFPKLFRMKLISSVEAIEENVCSWLSGFFFSECILTSFCCTPRLFLFFFFQNASLSDRSLSVLVIRHSDYGSEEGIQLMVSSVSLEITSLTSRLLFHPLLHSTFLPLFVITPSLSLLGQEPTHPPSLVISTPIIIPVLLLLHSHSLSTSISVPPIFIILPCLPTLSYCYSPVIHHQYLFTLRILPSLPPLVCSPLTPFGHCPSHTAPHHGHLLRTIPHSYCPHLFLLHLLFLHPIFAHWLDSVPLI